MSRSRKVCLLRRPAEIESLSKLRKLQKQIQAGALTKAEAAEQFKCAELPDCEHHHHVSIRQAHRLENDGSLYFLPGWGEHYAQMQMRSGRKFEPGMLVSGDRFIGRIEMYAVPQLEA